MSRSRARIASDLRAQREILREIIDAYDSTLVRAYCKVRFMIININILHMLQLCLRRKQHVLEIGCGFGLFGLYFAARNPGLVYQGFDLDEGRIAMARRAAARLGLDNVQFEVGDACGDLPLDTTYDGILMMDLLHHIPDTGKRHLIESVLPRLEPGGHLVIKDIMRQPAYKLGFTWLLDVLMTRSFDMWYWTADQFRGLVDASFSMEAYPITDWLPYPHVVYLFSRGAPDDARPAR